MTIGFNIATQLNTGDFGAQFLRFEHLIQRRTWLKRTRKILEEVKGHRLMESLLREENRIALTLGELTDYYDSNGRLPQPLIQSLSHYEACTLVIQFLDVLEKSTTEARSSIIGRMKGAFNNPDDMRAIQFEWSIALQLSKREFEVNFPEQSGEGTFDLLAIKHGVETEIECKSISHKRGRQIQRQDALRIHSMFEKHYSRSLRSLRQGLAVRVKVAQQLPKGYAEQHVLCKQIQRTILSGTSFSNTDVEIVVKDFRIAGSPFSSGEIGHPRDQSLDNAQPRQSLLP